MSDFLSFLTSVLIIALSFLILNWASNLTIKNAVKVAAITRLGKTTIGFSLIAFSTSLPELTVAFIAAFSGGAALSIGNVLGSNIVNVSIVVGSASLIVYYKTRKNKTTRHRKSERNIVPSLAKSELRNIYFGLFVSTIIPVVLIFVSSAAWIVGLILICIFVGYMYQLSKVRLSEQEIEPVTDEEKAHMKRIVISTIVEALMVVLSAYFLVESAVYIAQVAGLSEQVIGATIIALGTSLPELTLDLKAILRGHAGLAFGDIIGSSFVNITLILGITLFVPALIGTPITLSVNVFLNLILFSIVTNLIFWFFLSRGKIGHKEGLIFIAIYVLFVVTTIGLI
jgi:cation:H+ antiporter